MQRLQIVITAFFLLALTAYVGFLLYANLNALVAMESVKGWQKQATIPEEKSWQINFDRVQTAITLDSSNPEYLENEAQLVRMKARVFEAGSNQSIAANREALAKYTHLLTLRPSWAPYWGSIVAIKYDLREYDALMNDALRNAARLAPWFKANQHIIIQAGYHGWAFIDVETRAVVDKTLERALQLQPEETILFALGQGFFNRVKPYLQDDEKLQAIYQEFVDSEKKRLKREQKKEERRKKKKKVKVEIFIMSEVGCRMSDVKISKT